MALLICTRLGVCGPSAATAPLAPWARNGARTVGDQQADQNLQRPRVGLGRPLSGQRQKQEISHGPVAEAFAARDAPEAAVLMVLAGDRCADHDAVEPQIPRQRLRGEPRDALAHQRSPRDRGGNRRQNGVARRPGAERLQKLEEQRFAAAIADRLEHGFRTRIVRLVGSRKKQFAIARVDLDRAEIEPFIVGIEEPGMREKIDQLARAFERALHALRTDDRGRGRHHRIRRIARFASRVCGRKRRVADQVDLRGDRDVEHCPVVLRSDLMNQRQSEIRFERQQRQIKDGMSVHAGDLRLRIHHRGPGPVLHALARNNGADLSAERLDLAIVGRHRLDGRHRQRRR